MASRREGLAAFILAQSPAGGGLSSGEALSVQDMPNAVLSHHSGSWGLTRRQRQFQQGWGAKPWQHSLSPVLHGCCVLLNPSQPLFLNFSTTWKKGK